MTLFVFPYVIFITVEMAKHIKHLLDIISSDYKDLLEHDEPVISNKIYIQINKVLIK